MRCRHPSLFPPAPAPLAWKWCMGLPSGGCRARATSEHCPHLIRRFVITDSRALTTPPTWAAAGGWDGGWPGLCRRPSTFYLTRAIPASIYSYHVHDKTVVAEHKTTPGGGSRRAKNRLSGCGSCVDGQLGRVEGRLPREAQPACGPPTAEPRTRPWCRATPPNCAPAGALGAPHWSPPFQWGGAASSGTMQQGQRCSSRDAFESVGACRIGDIPAGPVPGAARATGAGGGGGSSRRRRGPGARRGRRRQLSHSATRRGARPLSPAPPPAHRSPLPPLNHCCHTRRGRHETRRGGEPPPHPPCEDASCQ